VEAKFDELHGKEVNKNKHIMEKLFTLVKKKHNLPNEVIKCLVRTRTFNCFNALNKMIDVNSSKTEKAIF